MHGWNAVLPVAGILFSTPHSNLGGPMRSPAIATGLVCLFLLAGCGQDMPTEPAAPEEAQFYRVKPDGSGADKNGDGYTCTKSDPSVKGPFLVDNDTGEDENNDGIEDCPEGYSLYGG